MFELISKYAHEGRDNDTGKPSGKFFVDRENAEIVTKPYVEKYLKLTQKDKQETFYKVDFEELF